MICFSSYEEITVHAKKKPFDYLGDFEKAIVRRDERGVYYDTGSPAYREMLAKYRPRPRSPHSTLAGRERHAQDWRGEDGRWVPVGWLRPGWFADPPQFAPLEGEQLTTPAFPAADFQATTGAEPIDVVIPLGTGSRHDDAELRYCLRSLEMHLENLGRVFVVGHRPAWLTGVEHIRGGDPSRIKDANILGKIQLACRAGCSPRFLRISDDQLLLRPLAASQLGPYHCGQLPTGGKGRWHQRKVATQKWLAARGCPTLDYECHIPAVIDRARFVELARRHRDCWTAGSGVTVLAWYLNQAEVAGRRLGLEQAYVGRPTEPELLRAAIAGRWFLGHNDAGFTMQLRCLLDELFPDKCVYEV